MFVKDSEFAISEIHLIPTVFVPTHKTKLVMCRTKQVDTLK